MGVPSYFHWLITNKKFKNKLLIEKIPQLPYALFLDLNCAIHPAVKANPKYTIEEMYMAVINYTNDIINFAKPTNIIYIAIDGVAPQAKMQQQRTRRYKASLEQKGVIDFNMISPGTDFMAELSARISVFYADDFRIIFSDASEPGEGEHKIFNYIRKHKDILTDKISLVYGLDSDLIFLSILNYNKYIYLLREKAQFGKIVDDYKSTYVYLDINKLRVVLANTLKTSFCIDVNRLIADYVFFCFFLGNDFLPSIPSLFIRDGGIDTLLFIYSKTINIVNDYLIDDTIINLPFMTMFIKELQLVEQDSLIIYDRNKTARINKYLKLKSNIKIGDTYVEHIMPDLINFGDIGWKKRYYSYYFYTTHKSEIKKIVHNYLRGMKWTMLYYTGKITDYSWFYSGVVAPAISDFIDILHINDITFIINEPVDPLVQLMYILPSTSSKLLPAPLAKLLTSNSFEFHYMYPVSITIDTMNKRYLHDATIKLPDLNVKLLKKIVINYHESFK